MYCNNELWKLFKLLKQRMNEVAMKKRVHRILENSLAELYPENQLYLKGSTVNKLGSHNSDLDLTLVMPSSVSTSCNDILAFETLVCAKNHLQNQPLLPKSTLLMLGFPFCNCVTGIYNSHLLRYFAELDERFVAMAVVIKKHCCKNGVLDSPNGRLNSYAITLMIVHFLQCGVHPPHPSNLMALFPLIFDGKSTAVEKLEYNWVLPIPKIAENKRTLAELVLGFYNYYTEFDYENDGVSISEARVFSKEEKEDVIDILTTLFIWKTHMNMTLWPEI
uniref:PAP-associated domain-containing protein n=1 Tax=Ditylenchus dipsaci TaxID=166011 RepID=A0A915DS06_9BILA